LKFFDNYQQINYFLIKIVLFINIEIEKSLKNDRKVKNE